MDRAIAKPDVFLAHYLSIIDDEDAAERRMTSATAITLVLVLLGSALLCAMAVGLLS